MRRGLLALLAVLVGLLTAATVSLAAGSTSSTPPPEVIHYKGKTIQETKLYEYHWRYFWSGGEDGSGWVTIADRAPGDPAPAYHFPKAVKVGAHTRVNVVIVSAQKPDKLTIRTKEGKLVPRHLYPMKNKDGRVYKWGAWFKVPRGEHKLVIRAKWERDPGTYHSYGHEARLAHLKAL